MLKTYGFRHIMQLCHHALRPANQLFNVSFDLLIARCPLFKGIKKNSRMWDFIQSVKTSCIKQLCFDCCQNPLQVEQRECLKP